MTVTVYVSLKTFYEMWTTGRRYSSIQSLSFKGFLRPNKLKHDDVVAIQVPINRINDIDEIDEVIIEM